MSPVIFTLYYMEAASSFLEKESEQQSRAEIIGLIDKCKGVSREELSRQMNQEREGWEAV